MQESLVSWPPSPCPSFGLQLSSGGGGGICWLGVEGNRVVWGGLMDGVHHGLEQRQAFGRESEATADHHTVIVGARQRLLEHRAPSGIWRDHASIALPPVFLYLFDAQGDPGVDLFGIETGRQGRVREIDRFRLLADEQDFGHWSLHLGGVDRKFAK